MHGPGRHNWFCVAWVLVRGWVRASARFQAVMFAGAPGRVAVAIACLSRMRCSVSRCFRLVALEFPGIVGGEYLHLSPVQPRDFAEPGLVSEPQWPVHLGSELDEVQQRV